MSSLFKAVFADVLSVGGRGVVGREGCGWMFMGGIVDVQLTERPKF